MGWDGERLYKVGARVAVMFDDDTWYGGMVTQTHCRGLGFETEYSVLFDDKETIDNVVFGEMRFLPKVCLAHLGHAMPVSSPCHAHAKPMLSPCQAYANPTHTTHTRRPRRRGHGAGPLSPTTATVS